MKKIMLSGAAAIALVAGSLAAQAADLPARYPTKAPALVQGYDWTGFYVGGNIGGSFGKLDDSATLAGVPLGAGSSNADGVIGGGQIGVNWQTAQWVWGIESDIQGTSQRASDSATSGGVAATFDRKLPWLGTVRGRVGLTIDPRWLVYVTGGLAYGEVDTNFTVGGIALINRNTTRTGWTVGGGVETALWDNWTAKLEYLHVDLGNFTNTDNILGILTVNTKTTDEIVRVGLNYRFHL